MKFLIFITGLFFFYGTQQITNKTLRYQNEKLDYNLRMGIVKIGEGVIKIENDSLLIKKLLSADVQTTGIIKLLYNAHYYYSADMNLITGLPLKANNILNEGKYYSENEVTFDRLTFNDSCLITSQLSGKKLFPKKTYDILTGFYKYRDESLYNETNNDTSWKINTYFADRAWDLKITYAGEEIIKTIWGKVKCKKHHVSTFEGPFFKNDDDLVMWFDPDHNYIPVKIKADLKIGSFICILTDYQTY